MTVHYMGIAEQDGQLGALLQYPNARALTATENGVTEQANPHTQFCTSTTLAAKSAIAKAMNSPDFEKLETIQKHLAERMASAETSGPKTSTPAPSSVPGR